MALRPSDCWLMRRRMFRMILMIGMILTMTMTI